MLQDRTNKVEEIRIQYFETNPKDGSVRIEESVIQIPMLSGAVVSAVVVKAINQMFFKDLMGHHEDMFPPEVLAQVNGVIDRYKERYEATKARSSLILPR